MLGSSGGTLLLEAGAAAGGDPLAAFRLSGGPVVATLIDAFTFLAVASTFVGFVLALTGFLADVLRVGGGTGIVRPPRAPRRRRVPSCAPCSRP